jgi:hypothetical protein
LGHLVPIEGKRFYNFKTKPEALKKNLGGLKKISTLKLRGSSALQESEKKETSDFYEMKRDLEKLLVGS